MILVYLFSHAALITTLPLIPENQGAGVMGMFVFLVVLTESNDIAQALWGRRWGRHMIMPRVSPHKTWEGFLLGAATTVGLALLLTNLLTPLTHSSLHLGGFVLYVPYLPAAIAGILIAVGGFFGDVTISTIKREVGVKDSGTLLPGQGGVLDRIDSLMFTAPMFFYFVYVFCD
jgi:phosphatidate cytidylyltransferase